MGRKIQWEVSKKADFNVNEKLYNHEPEKVEENDSWEILSDVTIQTNHIVDA